MVDSGRRDAIGHWQGRRQRGREEGKTEVAGGGTRNDIRVGKSSLEGQSIEKGTEEEGSGKWEEEAEETGGAEVGSTEAAQSKMSVKDRHRRHVDGGGVRRVHVRRAVCPMELRAQPLRVAAS